MISAVSFFAVVGVLGFTAMNFSQGTFVEDQGCGAWEPAVNPETGSVFESEQDVQSFFQENNVEMPEGFQVRTYNGELQYQTPCGTVGGDSSS